jgi:alpha-1,2-rhamnosyltransferase
LNKLGVNEIINLAIDKFHKLLKYIFKTSAATKNKMITLSRPTLFIECTHTHNADLNTGIPRVVRNILRNAPDVAARYGFDVIPVILHDGQFYYANINNVLNNKFDHRENLSHLVKEKNRSSHQKYLGEALRSTWRSLQFILLVLLPFPSAQRFVTNPVDRPGMVRSIRIVFHYMRLTTRVPPLTTIEKTVALDNFHTLDGSILLLLDSSWSIPIWPSVKRFKEAGGKIVGIIYDLIPITHRETCLPAHTRIFTKWLNQHIRFSDSFICISESIAESMTAFAKQRMANGKSIAPIKHFHLGSDLDFVNPDGPIRQVFRTILEKDHHVFLMVGSIEPRKNHGFVLDAFEKFWNAGGVGTLVLLGRHGWKTELFLERVRRHPQFGLHLFLIRDATDTELDYAYRTASSLVIASQVEGFGLPVVEAFQRGLRVMCSDIAVFREIAGGRARFFNLADPTHLTDVLMSFCDEVPLADRALRIPQSWIGWAESTEQLLTTIMELSKQPREQNIIATLNDE